MREIKFRAWLRDVMFPVDEIEWNSKNNKIIYVIINGCEYGFDEVKLMQFTGLKDKNGKEIYEGDILNDFGNIKGANRIGFVIFSEEHGAFMFDGFCGYPYFVRNNMAKECEVIGNKFENPELLK